MPHYLAIGVSKQEFMHSTLVELRPYDDAFKLRRKMQDERDYFVGLYTYEAVATVVGNALRPKFENPKQYRTIPLLQELEEKRRVENPTDEEVKMYTDDLFAMLGRMQSSFEHSPLTGK